MAKAQKSPPTDQEKVPALWPSILTLCVIPGGFCLVILAARKAPAFLRWALGGLFGQSRGPVWVLLQAEGWGQLPVLLTALAGIPLFIWALRYALRTGALRGSNHAANGRVLLFLPLVLLFLPWMMIADEQPLEILRTCQADRSALSAGESLVYEGRFSAVELGGGWGVDDSGPLFYVLHNVQYAGDPKLHMYCPIELGRQAELYPFSGGQATGRDGRRFRVEYLPNTGIVLSLEPLPSE